MSKFLLYVNEFLESLDIPTIANATPKSPKSTRKQSKDIFIEEK